VKGVHLSFLYGATFAVNLLALVLAIWLGLYLISRSPRHAISWLTALMLWLLAGVFLNVLLAINPPPVVTLKLTCLRYFFPFWRRDPDKKHAEVSIRSTINTAEELDFVYLGS
jgi:hypothetical protein